MKKLMEMMKRWAAATRIGTLLALGSVASLGSPAAHADMLLKEVTAKLIGTAADTVSFYAPQAGTVTAQISTIPWPVPLSALSFSVTTATDTLSWSTTAPSTTPQVQTFQVGAGTYFAHIMATVGSNPLNLGAYALVLTLTPSAVPLPAAVWMLLIGGLVLLGLRRTLGDLGPWSEKMRPCES